MINKEDAISISKSPTEDPKLITQVIQRYIFDMKNVEVSINVPNDVMNVYFMQICYDVAKKYYMNKN